VELVGLPEITLELVVEQQHLVLHHSKLLVVMVALVVHLHWHLR